MLFFVKIIFACICINYTIAIGKVETNLTISDVTENTFPALKSNLKIAIANVLEAEKSDVHLTFEKVEIIASITVFSAKEKKARREKIKEIKNGDILSNLETHRVQNVSEPRFVNTRGRFNLYYI